MSREYTFRWDDEMNVLWAGERSYPAHFRRSSFGDHIPEDRRDAWLAEPAIRMETRQAIVCFENRWCLSTIWGDSTYSSNYGWEFPKIPFIEEPSIVEVGVLLPDPITHPAEHHELPALGPLEARSVDIPERTSSLWGDPLAYVSVPEYHRVADLVMMLPSDIELPEGEWEDAQGFCDFLVTAGLGRSL